MAKEVHAAAVHRMLRLDGLDEKVEEGGAIRRHLPAAAIGRIGADDDETLLRGDIAKQLDERPSVAAGTVQRDDEGAGSVPTESGTNMKYVREVLSIFSVSFVTVAPAAEVAIASAIARMAPRRGVVAMPDIVGHAEGEEPIVNIYA